MSPIAVLISVCILAAVIAIWRPFWILPLFIMATFMEPVQYFPALKAYQPSALVGAIVVGGLIIHHLTHSIEKQVNTSQLTAFKLFFFWLTISSLVHYESSFHHYVAHLRSYIPFFLFVALIRKESEIKTIIWFLILFSLVSGVYGLYCAKMNIGVYDRGARRIVSFYSNPNAYGWVSSYMIPLVITQLFAQLPFKIKLGLWGQIGLLFLGIFFSGSRKCLFAVIPALFFTTTKFFTYERKVLVACLTLFAIGALYYVMPSGIKYRYTGNVLRMFDAESAEELDSGRTESARAGVALMVENPIFGVGIGGFRQAYEDIASRNPNLQLIRNANNNDLPFQPHNVIVEAGSFTGLIGLFFYILVVILTFREARLAEKEFIRTGKQNLRCVAVFVQAFVLTAMIIGQFSPFFTDKSFWIIISFATILRRLSYKESGEVF